MAPLHWFRCLLGTEQTESSRSSSKSDADRSETGGRGPGSDKDETSIPPVDYATELVAQTADLEYGLDYSPASVTDLDALVSDLDEDSADELGRAIGAYFGQVLVENYGGEWTYIEDFSWVVAFSTPAEGAEDELVSIPQVTGAVFEGQETFATIHDQLVDGLSLSGPNLSGIQTAEQTEPDGQPIDEAQSRVYEKQAAAFVEEWPAYELDYSPESLAEVDELIAVNYDMTPDEVDRSDRLEQGPQLGVPAGADLTLGTGGATTKIAAYVGEVYRRQYDATWHEGGFDSIVIRLDEETIAFEPELFTNAAYHGYVSFEAIHETMIAERGLEGNA